MYCGSVAGKGLTGPVKTAFDLDDQVPVRAVTLFRASVEGKRDVIRTTIAREVLAEKNIDRVVGRVLGSIILSVTNNFQMGTTCQWVIGRCDRKFQSWSIHVSKGYRGTGAGHRENVR